MLKWAVNAGGTEPAQSKATRKKRKRPHINKKVLRSFQLQIVQLRDEYTHRLQPPEALGRLLI